MIIAMYKSFYNICYYLLKLTHKGTLYRLLVNTVPFLTMTGASELPAFKRVCYHFQVF